MKNYLKVLLALLLVFACIFSYAACDNTEDPGTNPGGSVTPDTPPEQVDPGKPDETPGNTDSVPTYKLDFVYSYTTKVKNAYGRPTTEKQKITVKTIEVPVNNTGLTAEQRAEIANILYHGYGFADWYEEKNWVVDNANSTQYAVGDPYTFPDGVITSDMTLYGVKGDLAGREITWEISEETVSLENNKTKTEIILTLTGSGAMFDYAVVNAIDIPWYGYTRLDESGKAVAAYEQITKIVIGDGITYIGANAFNGLTSVSEVVFNDDITAIGDSAFKGLSSLKSFVAPDTLKTIGKNAFESTGLTSVWLNDGLEMISESAFYGSKGISWIVFPATVKTVGTAAFHPGTGLQDSNHSLSKVYYLGAEPEDGASAFASVDMGINNGPLKEKATVYYYTDIEKISDDMRGAYWYYFESTDVNGVTTVEPMQLCLTIKYYLPTNTVEVKWTDYIPAKPVLEVKKDDDGNVISSRYKLVGVVDGENVEFREKNIAYNGYKFAAYGDEGKYILNGAKSDFCEGASTEANMTCVLSRGKILSEGGGIVFTYSNSVLTISLDPVAIKEGASTNIWDFQEATDTGILWTGSIAGLKNIKEIVIDEGVNYIGTLTFAGITNVSSIVIPASVKGIGIDAFEGCTSLSCIYYNGNLSDCKLYKSGVDTGKTLADIDAIKAASATRTYSYSEKGTAEDGSYWTIVDGSYLAWTLDKTAGTLYIGGDASMVNFATDKSAPWYSSDVVAKVKKVEFAPNILTIGENAIHGYSNVEDIVIPVTVTNIPANSLAGTGLLKNTENYSGGALIINNILIKVDSRRNNKTLFRVPVNTVLIASGAFDGCEAIEEIYIPYTVRNVNKDALAGASNLKVIYIDFETTVWKNITSSANIDPSIYICGYDDYDLDPSGAIKWQFIPGYYDEDGKYVEPSYFIYADNCSSSCTHELVNGACKHVWGEWYEKKLPTHTTNGVLARPCLNEGCYAEDIDKETWLKVSDKQNGQYIHTFGDYTLDEVSHCVVNRTETATCIYCTVTDTREVEGTMIGGHNFLYHQDNNATCYAVGTKTGVCQNEFCGYEETVPDYTQPKTSHTLPDEYSKQSEATCLEEFLMVKICLNEGCGQIIDSYTELNGAVTPHIWVDKVATEYLCARATFTASNKYYKSCETCGVSSKNHGGETFTDVGSTIRNYEWDSDILADIINASGKFDLVTNLDKFTYAVGVIDGVNKVLEVGKNSGADNSIIRIANSNHATSSVKPIHMLDTAFRVGAFTETSTYLYRLGMSDGTNAFFNLYFVVAEGGIEIKTSLDDDAEVITVIKAEEWIELSVKYYAEILEEIITPEVDKNDPDWNPNVTPVSYTQYYRVVNITVNGTQYQIKLTELKSELLPNADTLAYIESEFAEDVDSAKVYFDDTCIRSITKAVYAVAENQEDDAVGGEPSTPDPVVTTPDYDFEEDQTSNDGLVKTPEEGVSVIVKDGKKDSEGKYVYIQSQVSGGALHVVTVSNDKGIAFTPATVFAMNGAAGDAEKVMYVFDANIILAGGVHQLVFANSTLNLQSLALDLRITDAGLVISEALEEADTESETGVTVAGITASTAFDLRVEIYRFASTGGNKQVAKIYVNDSYVGCTVISGNSVPTDPIEVVAIYHKVKENSSITIDNVSADVVTEDVAYVPEVVSTKTKEQ